MPKKITKRVVDAAVPSDRDRFIWDRDVKGLGLKITPADAKIYVLQYRFKGRLRRYTIGRHGSPWTAEQARTEAVRLLALVAKGTDPADLKREDRSDITFTAFAEGTWQSTRTCIRSRAPRHSIANCSARTFCQL